MTTLKLTLRILRRGVRNNIIYLIIMMDTEAWCPFFLIDFLFVWVKFLSGCQIILSVDMSIFSADVIIEFAGASFCFAGGSF